MRKTLALVVLTAALAQPAVAQNLEAMWGSSPNDVWALGPGVAVHFDGHAWTYQPVPVDVQDILGMDGSASSNIWAFGLRRGGTTVLYHWDGTQWATVALPDGAHAVQALAVGPTSVYVLDQGEDERDPAFVNTWDGQAWTRQRLPHSLVVAGMRVVGNELWVAGYVYHDPRPNLRNQHGVLLRRVAGRWVSTWTGRSSTNPLIDASSWTKLSIAGDRALLYGPDAMGAPHLLLRRGAVWQRVTLPTTLPEGVRYIRTAFLLGDGSLVLNYASGRSSVFFRQAGTAWEPIAATVTPTLPTTAWRPSPSETALTRGYTTWSAPGVAGAWTVVNPRMIGIMSTSETRILAASWCLGAPGGSGVNAAWDAGVCTTLGGAAATPVAPAAPAPAPAAPKGKRGTPPSGLPRPARP